MKGEVIYDGVSFFVGPCSAMTKDEFVARHVDAFWLDKPEKTRRKMLGEAYKLVCNEASPDTGKE